MIREVSSTNSAASAQPDLKKRKKEEVKTSELAKLHPAFSEYGVKLARAEEFIQNYDGEKPAYIPKRVSGQDFAIRFSEDGTAYILFKAKAELEGGTLKRASLAINALAKRVFVNATADLNSVSNISRAKSETRFWNLVKGGPNILSLADHYHYLSKKGTPKTAWLSEFCAEGELYNMVAEQTLSQVQKIQVAKDIARAVSYIHKKGLVHRDLKLENVFLDENGRATLADFDLMIELNKLGIAGSPGFFSPEVIHSILTSKAVASSAQQDVYSLGVVFYLLIHYPNSAPPAWMAQEEGRFSDAYLKMAAGSLGNKLYEEPPKETIDWIIWKMLRFEPGERYPSATEVLADLEKYT